MTTQKLLSYGSLHGGDIYHPDSTLLQAAFVTSSLLAPALHVEPEPTAEQEAADDDAASAAARNGRGAAGPRTVMDQIVDVICAAYVPDESDSSDKPNPATVAIEQMVVKVRPGALARGSGQPAVR